MPKKELINALSVISLLNSNLFYKITSQFIAKKSLFNVLAAISLISKNVTSIRHIKSQHPHLQLPPMIINTGQDASAGPVTCITHTFTNPTISNSDVTVSRIVSPEATATVVTTELPHATITNVTQGLEEPPVQSIELAAEEEEQGLFNFEDLLLPGAWR